MTRLFAIFVALSVSTFSFAEGLTFKNRGQLVQTVPLAEIATTLKVAAEVVPIWEPHMQIERKYRGFPFRSLLTAIYGKAWETSEEILFTCADGYQPSVPTDKFRQHVSYLAFELPGQPFMVDNTAQNEKNLDLGPFYLVWENIKNVAIRADGMRDWPYQVVGVDLIKFSDRFPRLAPPRASTPAVKRGFLAFRQHCVQCHSINGEGASGKAPELNYPASVTQYMRAAWLEKWILDPVSVRFNTTMPAFKEFAQKDPKLIPDLMAYLKAMARNKKAPK